MRGQPPSVFIAGTDTDAGKTHVTALLARYLSKQGLRLGVQKPVSTGRKDGSDDLAKITAFAGISYTDEKKRLAAPCCFGFPASPHLSAAMENKHVSVRRINRAVIEFTRGFDLTLIEGVGGLMVPLTRKITLLDVLAEWRLPTLLVGRAGLGTLNHSLLSIEALKRCKIPVIGVILNTIRPGDDTIADDNIKMIAKLGQVPVFGRVPYGPLKKTVPAFERIGKSTLRHIRLFYPNLT